MPGHILYRAGTPACKGCHRIIRSLLPPSDMRVPVKRPHELSSLSLIAAAAVFLTVFHNVAFFSNVLDTYPVTWANVPFLASIAAVMAGTIFLLLSLVCYRITIKPVLIAVLLTSSVAAYFMDSYNTVIDVSMLRNVAQTNAAESLDLLSPKLLLYVVLIGVLPALFVYRTEIVFRKAVPEIFLRLKAFSLIAVASLGLIILFGSHYSSFFREHKGLRYYANPGGYINATVRFAGASLQSPAHALVPVGLDAHIPEWDNHRELIVMVVGETARSDRFSLNGYGRETNPLLARERLTSFTNFWSCGTSTAISVPCMFTVTGSSAFDPDTAADSENLLDVLTHAGVNVLWLDNNSDSKGVASRVAYQSYREADTNPVCDVECRDEGMLTNLQAYIDSHPKGDIFIVLHQMGNHGPAYYKRYPANFEHFKPVCKTNELEECSDEEISNAYDNAILYTDYFLSRVIGLLKRNAKAFETAMFYVSDHGESLGEKGLYLHGLPEFIAPDAQRHVSAIIWVGDNFEEIDVDALALRRDEKFTHDNVVHTVLGFMEIQSGVYHKEMDILTHLEEEH